MSEFFTADHRDTSPKQISVDLIFNQLRSEVGPGEHYYPESIERIDRVKEMVAEQVDLSIKVDESEKPTIRSLIMGDISKSDPDEAAEKIIQHINQINQS